MAVDYSQYAQIYGGGQAQQGASQLGAGIGAGFGRITNVMDRLASSQGEGLDNAFAPLLGLLGKGVEEWGDIDKIPSAGEAYMGWVNSMSPRQKKMARRSGVLNPVAYKQQYDAQMEMYLPAIKEKLESYRTMGNKTDKSMREFLSTKPGLNQFFLANTSPEELALSPYFKPTKTWGQWAEGRGGAPGIASDLATVGLGGLGVAKTAGPTIKGVGRLTGLTTPSYSSSELSKMSKLAEGKIGRGLDKNAVKRVSRAQGAETRAKNALEEARKKYKGKKFKSTTKGPGSYKALNEKLISKTKALNTAKTKVGEGPLRVINKYVKKHGTKKLVQTLGKKFGVMGGLKLAGQLGFGTALSGTGVGTAVGVGLNALTLIQIANVLGSLGE